MGPPPPSGPSGEIMSNTYTTSFQSFPKVAVDEQGNFNLVWNSYYQDGNLLGVIGQRV